MKNWKKTLVHTVALWLLSLAPGMAQSLPDPGNIGTPGSGGSPADPGNTSGTGAGPLLLTPDPYLRPYAQELSEEQRAAVLENLGLTGGGSGVDAVSSTGFNLVADDFSIKPDSTVVDGTQLGLSTVGQLPYTLAGNANAIPRAVIRDGAWVMLDPQANALGALYAYPGGDDGLGFIPNRVSLTNRYFEQDGSDSNGPTFLMSQLARGLIPMFHLNYGPGSWFLELWRANNPLDRLVIARGTHDLLAQNGEEHTLVIEWRGNNTVSIIAPEGSGTTVVTQRNPEATIVEAGRRVTITHPEIDEYRSPFACIELIGGPNPVRHSQYVRWSASTGVVSAILSENTRSSGDSVAGSVPALPNVFSISSDTGPTQGVIADTAGLDEIHVNIAEGDWAAGAQQTVQYIAPDPSHYTLGHEISLLDVSRSLNPITNPNRAMFLFHGGIAGRSWRFLGGNNPNGIRYTGGLCRIRRVDNTAGEPAWLVLQTQ